MIVMLDTSQDMTECSRQLGNIPVEQLFTPLTRRNAQQPNAHFAMDNGAFSKFNANGFYAMLNKHADRKALCRWVAVPDVVADARRTLEVFRHWSRQPELADWPLAFVCQDGQEHLPIPWGRIEAVFIGGSTEWKLSADAAACVKAGKAMGKWVHVGRVNTPGRYDYFAAMGADSCDGTGLAQYENMRAQIKNSLMQSKLNLDPIS